MQRNGSRLNVNATVSISPSSQTQSIVSVGEISPAPLDVSNLNVDDIPVGSLLAGEKPIAQWNGTETINSGISLANGVNDSSTVVEYGNLVFDEQATKSTLSASEGTHGGDSDSGSTSTGLIAILENDRDARTGSLLLLVG